MIAASMLLVIGVFSLSAVIYLRLGEEIYREPSSQKVMVSSITSPTHAPGPTPAPRATHPPAIPVFEALRIFNHAPVAGRPSETTALSEPRRPVILTTPVWSTQTTPAPASTPTSSLEPTPDHDIPTDEELKAFVEQMSLREKVGQMMLVGFHSQTLSNSPELATLISQYHVGGIVLLESNAHDPEQIASLTSTVQELAAQTGQGIPPFVAINHEGGIVVRITEGVTGFPGNMAIAASGRPEYAYTAAALAAEELRAMGINMNLAPVLDVNDNPLNPIIGVRSFGEEPDQVTALGKETIRGFQENGVVAVAKHFPGHGSSGIDSHVGLPKIDKKRSELEQVELPPFQMAVDEEIEAVMVAHVVVPALGGEPHLPAVLSPAILTDLLRQEMGFDGIVMTDSLGMGAIVQRWGQVQAAVEAVKAGTDIVLSMSPLHSQTAIHKALVTAVQDEEISMAQIDESVLRILRVKHEYGLFQRRPENDLTEVGSAKHRALAEEMALASVTLFKDNANLVPLPENTQSVLVLSPDELPPANTGEGTLFAQELRKRGVGVRELVFNLTRGDQRDAVYAKALRLAPEHDLVIFGEWELVKRYANWSDQWQENLIADLRQAGKPMILVSWRDPGAILRVPEVPTFLIAYGTTVGQVRATVKILTGEASPQGKLPLSINMP